MSIDWDYSMAVGEIDHLAHTGLILAEDAALKEYLMGITVPDKNGMTNVDVWFRYPEGERRIKYPFITIDFLGMSPAFDRWTSVFSMPEDFSSFENPVTGEVLSTGMYIPSVSPELPAHTVTPGNTTSRGYEIKPYLMYTLMYQIAVHSRSALQDRYLLSRFMTDILPPRPFWIGVEADQTFRRCELVEMQPADTMETTESGNKRIFRKIYTITMDAEIPQSTIEELYKVSRVHTDVYANTSATESVTHAYNSTHTIGEPVTVVPPSGS